MVLSNTEGENKMTNDNYYGIYESIEGELIEAMNSAIEEFILDIPIDGIDLLNSNFPLKYSTTGHMTEEDAHLEELADIFNQDYDITTATPLVQRYTPLWSMDQTEQAAYTNQIREMGKA